MSRRSTDIACIIIGMILAISGCKKDNHEAIIHIGDESYMKTVDQIYPIDYRNLWPSIYTNCTDTVYDGLFPPDITGLYEIEGLFGGSNMEHFINGSYIPNAVSPKRYYYLLIEEQINGIAKLKIKTKNNKPLPRPFKFNEWYTIDTAYIFGYVDTLGGHFSLSFNMFESAGDFSYSHGFIINANIPKANENQPKSLTDVEVWNLIKARNPDEDLPLIMKVGGQDLYYNDSVQCIER